MSGPIRVALAIELGVDPTIIAAALGVGAGVRIVDTVDGFDSGTAPLENAAADVGVVACAGYGSHVSAFVTEAVAALRGRPLIVLCEGASNGFVGDAFDAGADDIVVLPAGLDAAAATAVAGDVRFSIDKALARRNGNGQNQRTGVGELICVLSPKGGTGKTLTCCNLGVALATAGHRVAIVDLDLQFGDVGLALGLEPQHTIYDLARSGGELDAEKLDAFLTTHASGLRVLLAPKRPDQAAAVTPAMLRELYAVMRSTFDFVIVDTPPGFTPEVIASIDVSSRICMIAMLDSLSLKNTKLGLETLDLMGYDAGRIRLVLNRAGSRIGISHDDVETIVGRPVDLLVPSHRDVARSVTEATPIVMSSRTSEAGRAFRALATTFVEDQRRDEPRDAGHASGRKRRRLWRRRERV